MTFVYSPLRSSIALYGLLLFYGLTKDELVGRRPLAKFLSIKLIVMFTFYQSFVVGFGVVYDVLAISYFLLTQFKALEGKAIHGDFMLPFTAP